MFKIYFGASATTNAYTITAAVGSFALTGQAASFSHGYTITADPGSFALTGQASSFVWLHILAAGVASYTLTGNAAVLAVSQLGVYFYPGTRDLRRAVGRGVLRARVREPIEAEG